MENPVTFQVEGQQVVGMLHLPSSGNEPVPGVVFLHGFTGNKTESGKMFVLIARALADHGIAALRFDFRGSGDSQGGFEQATIESEVADAKAAADYLRSHEAIDADRIGVVGMSMGGLIASLLLAEDQGLKAAALLCPVGKPLAAIELKRHDESSNQLAEKGFTDIDGWPVSGAFIEQLGSARPIDAIVNSEAPVLLVHGDKDEAVDVEESVHYEEALLAAGRTCSHHVIPGANHTFSSLPWKEEVVRLTEEWLKRHLAGIP